MASEKQNRAWGEGEDGEDPARVHRSHAGDEGDAQPETRREEEAEHLPCGRDDDGGDPAGWAKEEAVARGADRVREWEEAA